MNTFFLKQLKPIFLVFAITAMSFISQASGSLCADACLDQVEGAVLKSVKFHCPIGSRVKVVSFREQKIRDWLKVSASVLVLLPNKEQKTFLCHYNATDSMLHACELPEECFMTNDGYEED